MKSILAVFSFLAWSAAIGQDTGLGLWEGNNKLEKFPTIEQPDQISCGPTSVAMVLKYYGKSANIGSIKTKAGTTWLSAGGRKVGMTFPSGMKKALEGYGLAAKVGKGDVELLMKLVDKKRPPIVLLRSGKDLWHYVVVIGYKHNVNAPRLQLLLADPAGGKKYWISSDRFEGAWRFSHDLKGKAMKGRKCRMCEGDGRINDGWTKCATCGGSGKQGIGGFSRDCVFCGGRGTWTSAGSKCPTCRGDGEETDYHRKIVESSRVGGNTYIVVTGRTGGSGVALTDQGDDDEVGTFINDEGTVELTPDPVITDQGVVEVEPDPEPQQRPTVFNHSAGSFRKEGDEWIEIGREGEVVDRFEGGDFDGQWLVLKSKTRDDFQVALDGTKAYWRYGDGDWNYIYEGSW